jgi:hypothetical protein
MILYKLQHYVIHVLSKQKSSIVACRHAVLCVLGGSQKIQVL